MIVYSGDDPGAELKRVASARDINRNILTNRYYGHTGLQEMLVPKIESFRKREELWHAE